jgi:uncharacterized protein
MANILNELLQRLEDHFARRAAPPVRAIHPPPGGSGESSSPFTLVLLGGDAPACGLSYNLLEGAEARARYDALDVGALAADPALVLARRVLADGPQERVVGYAACHALSQLLLREHPARATEQDLLELLAPGAGDHVGLVGFASRLVRRLFEAGAGRVTVLERPDRAPDPADAEGAEVSTSADDLAACSKVLFTSTTLLNNTFDGLEAQTRGAGFRAVYGPGAPVLPEPLFERGIDAVAGLIVTDAEVLVRRQLSGRRWGDARRKVVLLRG